MVCASVVIADRYPVVVHGVISVLSAATDFNIAASCCDGIECIKVIRNLLPDIALLDISMPGLSGLDILAAISLEELPTRVVLFATSADDPGLRLGATRAAYGVVLKDMAPEILVQCLRRVAAGYRMWRPAHSQCEPGDQHQDAMQNAISETALAALTPREAQIMRLVSEGLTNKEIGRYLKISDGTIKVHLHNIYQKLAISNRTTLAAMALSRRKRARTEREFAAV